MCTLRVTALLLLVLLLGPFGGAAHAASRLGVPDPNTVSAGLRGDRLYVEPGQGELDAAGAERVRKALADAGTPIYLVVTGPIDDAAERTRLLSSVARGVGSVGVYGLMAGRHFQAGSTGRTGLKGGEADELAVDAVQGNQGDAAGVLLDFVDEVDVAAGKKASGTEQIVNYVLLGLLIVAAAGLFVFFRRRKRRQAEAAARQVAELRAGVQEDVTLLGEDIAALDLNVVDPALDPVTREEYTKALDSYDRAKAATDAIRQPQDVQRVTEALEDGRYEMTAVRARLAGDPVPERRAPCFFNPQHGPSVRDVLWAPPGGAA
ncbi:LPXTG cell wall anchor domain-containing protein, partial [Actinocorallia lasiicapitis]